MSRRKFVAGVGGGLVIGAVAGAAIGAYGFPKTNTVTTTSVSTSTSTLPAVTSTVTQAATQTIPSNLVLSIPSTWDHTADVVVVGAGGAGLSAAVGALESGASVIVLEKAPAVGGTTGVSGGGMWVPNSSLAVAASPATISSSNLQQYLSAIGESELDQNLLTTYLQGSPGWVDHLIQVYGMTFVLATTFVCYYNVPGAQGTGLQVSPTGGGPGISAAGAGIIQTLNAAVKSKGGTIMTSTPATALYMDATGRILGLKATSSGSTINIAAKKGVILAAGGYDQNAEMMSNYQRGPVHFTSAALGNTGDGILMAMAAGADIRNMNNAWGCPHYNTPNGGVADWGLIRGKPGVIIVNSAGERFTNESSAYPVINRTFYEWSNATYGYPNMPAYAILDQTCVNNYGFVTYLPGSKQPSYVSSANTLQALAAALNINPSGLQATVTQFNQYAANGVDPDFNRGVFSFDLNTTGDPKRTDLKNICLGPIQTPPYYGLEIDPGTIGTSGGPRINSSAQVLDKLGNPIPGLYAAGNDSASPFGAAYPGGGATVGPATFFGWVAGKTAGTS